MSHWKKGKTFQLLFHAFVPVLHYGSLYSLLSAFVRWGGAITLLFLIVCYCFSPVQHVFSSDFMLRTIDHVFFDMIPVTDLECSVGKILLILFSAVGATAQHVYFCVDGKCF